MILYMWLCIRVCVCVGGGYSCVLICVCMRLGQFANAARCISGSEFEDVTIYFPTLFYFCMCR